MKKLAVLALSIATFALGANVLASGQATMSLSPASRSVDVGDSFSIVVSVDPNGATLDTVRADISFTASMLEVTDIDLGTLFPAASPGNSTSNTNGTLSYGAYKYGGDVTDSGTFATITFHALSSGTATISVTDDSRLISAGEEMIDTTDLGSATVTIGGSGTAEAIAEEEDTSDSSLEAQALVYFGACAGRMPSSAVDWEALHCMAYDDCYPTDAEDRRVDREAQSLVIYGEKYGEMPTTSMDWNAAHSIAYTEIFYDWSEMEDGTEVTEETEVTEDEEVVGEEDDEETITQDEALGLFGQITGYLPSSSADWLAIDYMVEGYTPSADERDVDAESAAIAKFGEVFGELPSSSADWNVVAAIAYSGAIL